MYDSGETMDIKQASQYCNRNPETVRRWVWNGKLPAEKIGNQLFIRRQDLVQFCHESAIAYQAEPQTDEGLFDRISELRGRVRLGTGRGLDAGREVESLREERDEMIKDNNFMERARSARKAIRARTGRVFSAEDMIRELRDDRDNGLR